MISFGKFDLPVAVLDFPFLYFCGTLWVIYIYTVYIYSTIWLYNLKRKLRTFLWSMRDSPVYSISKRWDSPGLIPMVLEPFSSIQHICMYKRIELTRQNTILYYDVCSKHSERFNFCKRKIVNAIWQF